MTTIVGAGLAGCCLAWQMYFRKQPFLLIDHKEPHGSSIVAAGLVSPVAGKAFNASWQIDDYYQPALSFYARIEEILQLQLWHPLPILRPFYDDKDRTKFEKKRPLIEKWIEQVLNASPVEITNDCGAVIWKGGGRLNAQLFCEATREFFKDKGAYETQHFTSSESVDSADSTATDRNRTVFCTGAQGLVAQQPLAIEHRSAKGEILTLKIPDLSQEHIISRGGWLVPIGNESFLAGANYEWDDLTNTPTEAGKQDVLEKVRNLIPYEVKVTHHVAGVRPIITKSQPVLKKLSETEFFFNGLGSKGVLYAPKCALEILDSQSSL